MTKLFKRFISFSMAMVISLSFSLTAFAAENTAFATEINKDTVTENSVTPDNIVVLADDGFGNISGQKSGYSVRAPLKFSFTVPAGGAYLYFIYSCDTSITLSIFKNNSRVLYTNYAAHPDSGGHTILLTGVDASSGFWGQGTYTVEIVFGAINQSYALCIYASPYRI